LQNSILKNHRPLIKVFLPQRVELERSEHQGENLMAGVAVSSYTGGRRPLDSEINMIPMIDFLMVTVSFLLITAVWSQMKQVEVSAQVPGQVGDAPEQAESVLHVRAEESGAIRLEWKGPDGVKWSRTLARNVQTAAHRSRTVSSFIGLSEAVTEEYAQHGVHALPTDPKRDRAIIHTPATMPYGELVAIMDAINTPKRLTVRGKPDLPAFQLVLATD
jgi:biopolymer transport protein ExbD